LASPTRTLIATGTFTVNSTVTRYNANISVPAAATTGIEIVLTVGAQTSGTWTIGNVQLEAGTVATPFERRSYGQELALCQRYYHKVKHDGVASNRLTTYGLAFASSGVVAMTTFPVGMRANVTAVEQSGTAGHYAVFASNGGQLTCTAVPTFNSGDKTYAETAFSVASGLVAGNASVAVAGNAAAYLGWSAEL
jgi:hypothetical protein